MNKLGITSAQYKKIDELLTGMLNIEDNVGNLIEIPDPKKLSTEELLQFVYSYLYHYYYTTADSISNSLVVNLIYSAFGVSYKPKQGDNYDDALTYKGGKFEYLEAHCETDDNSAYPYSLTRISPNQIMLKFDIVDEGNMGAIDYNGKGQAILEEDKNSLFGYHLVSFGRLEDSHLQFTSAAASSFLPAKGSKTFDPFNAIDGNEDTGWGTAKKAGEWIQVNFSKPQDITSLRIYFGDWKDGYAGYDEQPADFRLEFSDGTAIDVEDEQLLPEFVSLGRVVTTQFVKITILDFDPDFPGDALCISEVSVK